MTARFRATGAAESTRRPPPIGPVQNRVHGAVYLLFWCIHRALNRDEKILLGATKRRDRAQSDKLPNTQDECVRPTRLQNERREDRMQGGKSINGAMRVVCSSTTTRQRSSLRKTASECGCGKLGDIMVIGVLKAAHISDPFGSQWSGQADGGWNGNDYMSCLGRGRGS